MDTSRSPQATYVGKPPLFALSTFLWHRATLQCWNDMSGVFPTLPATLTVSSKEMAVFPPTS